MKTSVIEVRDMLSVLSVSGVEERIGEVPGVESVTVNFSAGSATVRYDETRLDVSDIKSDVRQRASDGDPSQGTSVRPGDVAKRMADMPHGMPAPATSEPAPGKPAAAGATSSGAAPKDNIAPTTTSAPAPDAAVAAPAAANGNESPPKS